MNSTEEFKDVSDFVRYDKMFFLLHCFVFVPAILLCLLAMLRLLRRYGYISRGAEAELESGLVHRFSTSFRTLWGRSNNGAPNPPLVLQSI